MDCLEPTIDLSDGSRYTPDFFIKNMNVFVEIKGFERGPSLRKVNTLRSMGRTVLYADGEVLENDFGLNLKPDYLNGLVREFTNECI